MPRLNLTLDKVTYERLSRHARHLRSKRAGVARKLLIESLDRLETLERMRALARAYAADRDDREVCELLRDLEVGQLDLMNDCRNTN
jgi:hypothetical protein